jgi:hypothetical protein
MSPYLLIQPRRYYPPVRFQRKRLLFSIDSLDILILCHIYEAVSLRSDLSISPGIAGTVMESKNNNEIKARIRGG